MDITAVVLDWQAVLVGLGAASILASANSLVLRVVKTKADPRMIPNGEDENWQLWETATGGQHTARGGLVLGLLETWLLYAALLTATEIAVGGWLAFKIAAKWDVWSHIVSPAKDDVPFPGKSINNLWARHRWGVWLHRRFLLGTLWNVTGAGIGVLLANWLAIR